MLNRTALIASAATAALALAACSPPNENPSTATGSSTPSAASVTTQAQAQAVTFTDGVVREKGEDSDMTAIFGTLTNDSDEDVEVTGFSTSLDAPMNQIHETIDGTMRERTSPLVIPAGESVTLAPGGDHFMVMGYEPMLMAGDVVDLTIQLAGGDEVTVKDVPVRTMGAGHENYGEGAESTEMTGHQH